MRKAMRSVMAAGVVLVVAACGMNTAGATPRGSMSTITHDQMVDVGASSVYDAVQKLQPSWLTSRGPTSMTDSSPSVASVFMNGNQVGDIEYLRGVRLDDVEAVRYYEPGEAGARFGMGHQRGVIEVIPNGGRR